MDLLEVYPKGEYHEYENSEKTIDFHNIWGQFYWADVLNGLSNLVICTRIRFSSYILTPLL